MISVLIEWPFSRAQLRFEMDTTSWFTLDLKIIGMFWTATGQVTPKKTGRPCAMKLAHPPPCPDIGGCGLSGPGRENHAASAERG